MLGGISKRVLQGVILALSITAVLATGVSAQVTQQPDNEPPVANCRDNSIQAIDSNCCAYVDVYDIDNGSYDPEEDIYQIVIVSVDGSPVGPTPEVQICELGVHEVTLQIEDYDGLTDTCTALVTIWNDPPVAQCHSYSEHADNDG
jgi:hypothetical protein